LTGSLRSKPEEKFMKTIALSVALAAAASSPAVAQSQKAKQAPVIHINVSRTIQMVGYRNREATRIDFQGTALLPRSEGKAKIESKDGRTTIQAEIKGLVPASSFGSPYLTYVLWAISPEGRPNNLGEIVLKGSSGKLNTSVRLQTFGMIVTAEPYFAVTFPSDAVILENIARADTLGSVGKVDAKYELFQRGNYDSAQLEAFNPDPRVPFDVWQARNAVRIAKWQQADQYAAESFAKAQESLAQAEDYTKRKDSKSASAVAREAVQKAEDARVIAVKRQEEERIALERREREEREAKAKAEAEAEARRAAAAEAERRAAEAARRAAEEAQKAEEERRAAAEKQRREAEAAAAREAQARAEAEAARQREAEARAEAEAARQSALEKERMAAELAERERAVAQREREAAERAEREKQQLRAMLLAQFSRILQTRDTERGLVVTMADILFDFGKYDLRPEAREALAKLSGIVLAHPGLKLAVEGHTDNVGGDEFNQVLSEKRAEAVRGYLIQQGLEAGTITAMGFGKTRPVASNDTPAGRQQNRRVELVVSGEVIGTKISEVRPNN
jgi:outer membrane protein OmpA-like peptidoglycan-associated protein